MYTVYACVCVCVCVCACVRDWTRDDRWLLISRNATATSGSGVIPTCSYAQRLATLNGLPPASGCAETVDVFNTWGSPYQADYIFSVCGDSAQTTIPGSERQGGQTIVNIITNN